MRTLAEAAYITPDADPLKADLASFLDSNLNWYNTTYATNATGNKLGLITNGFALGYDNGVSLAPWQDDFFTSAIGHAAELGFTKAATLLAWKAKSPIGRLETPGICWIDAVKYTMQVHDTDSSPIYDSWSKVQLASRGAAFMALPCGGAAMAAIIGAQVGDMGGNPGYTMGYPANLQPALAYSVDSGIPSGKAAWALFQTRTIKPDYSLGAQFSIIPR